MNSMFLAPCRRRLSGLAAVSVSGSQISLSWTASASATGYNVRRALASGGPYNTLPGT